MPFVIVFALASLVGIWAGGWITADDWWSIGAAGVCLLAVGRLLGRRSLLVSLVFLLGIARVQLGVGAVASDDISRLDGAPSSEIVLRIDDLAERRATFQRIRGTAVSLITDGVASTASGRALLDLPPGGWYRPGDRLRLRGRIERPVALSGIDYPAILARQGIRATVRFPEILDHSPGEWRPETFFPRVRDHLVTVLESSLSDPAAGLAIGLLVGGRSSVPPNVSSAFAETGTSHLLAVSGFNVALVGGTTLAVLVPLIGRRPGTIAALLVVAGYTLLNGAPPSAIRAAVMGSLAYLAILAGRQRDAGPLLVVTAAALVWVTPDLLADIGFQLSVFATGGLVWIAPLLDRQADRALARTPASLFRPAVADAVTTCAAILATGPIVAGAFGSVSIVALPANLVAAAFVPPAMVTSLITLSGALIAPETGRVVAGPAWLTLSGLASVVTWFSEWPAASVRFEPPPPIAGFVFYAILGGVVWLGHQRLARCWAIVRVSAVRIVVPIAVMCAAVLLVTAVRRSEPGLGLAIAGDTGSAVVLRTPDGRTLVYGGGQRPAETIDLLRSELPWWDRTIDVVVLRDWSDAGRLSDLARRYTLRQVVAPVPNGQADERARDQLRLRGQELVEVAEPVTANIGGLGLYLRSRSGVIDLHAAFGDWRMSIDDLIARVQPDDRPAGDSADSTRDRVQPFTDRGGLAVRRLTVRYEDGRTLVAVR